MARAGSAIADSVAAAVAIVYHVWEERNGRMFPGESRQIEDIVKIITNEIQIRVCRTTDRLRR